MAITKYDEIYLYTAITANAQQCWEVKKYLVDNNVKYTTLHYGDDSQHEEVFNALNTWWEDASISTFPILIALQVRDDVPISEYKKVYFTSLDEVANSDFLTYAVKNS